MNAAKLVVPAAAALLLLTLALKEARGGDFVVLKEGTPVVVKLTEDFDGPALKEGAKVPLAVAEKVTREGFTLIDAGAPVDATFVPDKRRIEGGGILISSAEAVDGQDVMLRLTPEVPEGVEADAAAGQLPLYIPAGNQRMTEGTTFRVYLSESYFIEE
jgi:hypothetical protein